MEANGLLILNQAAAWLCLFRVMCMAVGNYNEVLSYQALSNHPSLPLGVQESQHMMMISLIVLLCWGIPSCVAKQINKTCWWLTAVVDLTLVGFIIIALVKTAQYFPTKFPRCAQSDDSEPIGKFFTYVALAADNDNSTPGSACRDFLKTWVCTIMISYVWVVPSVLGTLNLSLNATSIVLMLFYFPLVLALGLVFGMFMLGTVAIVGLTIVFEFLYKYVAPPIKILYKYVAPPIKWSLWHVSWLLRIVWSALEGIVPSIRYLARVRLKREVMAKSRSVCLDLENGRYASSSGSVLHVAETQKTWIEPHSDSSDLSIAARFPSQQIPQAGDTEPSKNLLSNFALKAGICEHSNDWHCWACGVQACSQCSISKCGLPSTTQHFFCEPRCSRCYLNTMCGILPAKKSITCSHRQDRCEMLQTPRVCRSCSENCSGDELLRRLEKLEREELLHLARHNLKCGVCENRLQPKGPRWWTCCDCNEECNSDCHPSWSRIPE